MLSYVINQSLIQAQPRVPKDCKYMSMRSVSPFIFHHGSSFEDSRIKKYFKDFCIFLNKKILIQKNNFGGNYSNNKIHI